jgi:hypothetical protein
LADNGKPVPSIPFVDYAAFIDSQWHDVVLFVCKMLEVYSMSELWGTDIVKFTKLVHKAEQILKDKQKAAMSGRG